MKLLKPCLTLGVTLWVFLFNNAVSAAEAEPGYPAIPEQEVMNLLDEKMELVLDNLQDFADTEALRPYRKRMVREYYRECQQKPGCTPENVTIEDFVGYISSWQSTYLSIQPVDMKALQGVSEDGVSPLSRAFLPAPRMDCTPLLKGENTVRYGSSRSEVRKVQVFVDPGKARTRKGPLVFYWHGSNEDWDQIWRVMGYTVSRIVAEGGIVVAPHAGNHRALPWHVMNPFLFWKNNDYHLADQIVACAEKQFDIDNERIYSVGFSAGGIQTAAMGRRRSAYIAAIASYSGGQLPWFRLLPNQSSRNYYPAYITYGTPGKDNVPGVEFARTSASLKEYLQKRKHHDVVVCEKHRGHRMSSETPGNAWDYLKNIRYKRLSKSEARQQAQGQVRLNPGRECR